MRSAGTWPSTTYLPTIAVWHDSSSAGTPIVRFMGETSSTSCTVGAKPLAVTCSTHLAQQLQLLVLYTVIATGLKTWADRRDATSADAAPASEVRSQSRLEIMPKNSRPVSV